MSACETGKQVANPIHFTCCEEQLLLCPVPKAPVLRRQLSGRVFSPSFQPLRVVSQQLGLFAASVAPEGKRIRHFIL